MMRNAEAATRPATRLRRAAEENRRSYHGAIAAALDQVDSAEMVRQVLRALRARRAGKHEARS